MIRFQATVFKICRERLLGGGCTIFFDCGWFPRRARHPEIWSVERVPRSGQLPTRLAGGRGRSRWEVGIARHPVNGGRRTPLFLLHRHAPRLGPVDPAKQDHRRSPVRVSAVVLRRPVHRAPDLWTTAFIASHGCRFVPCRAASGITISPPRRHCLVAEASARCSGELTRIGRVPPRRRNADLPRSTSKKRTSLRLFLLADITSTEAEAMRILIIEYWPRAAAES